MSASLLIKGGRVIDPSQGLDAIGDVLLLEGKVAAVKHGKGLAAPEGTPVFDAGGLVVTPGFVDLHCHLREPGFEHKETIATGTRAAARGGFTTVCCMPNTDPAIDTRATVEFILERARAEGTARVLPIGAVTKSRAGKHLAELAELADAGCAGFSDDGSPVADARLMRSALSYARPLGVPIMDHCEDPALAGGCMHEGHIATRLGLRGVPTAAEENMVARDILLAELTGGQVHICHVSTAGSVELIRRARGKGLPLTAEVTPHHLTLTHEWVLGQPDVAQRANGSARRFPYDTNTKVNPPLREASDVEALIAALREGILQAIATDHAPHAMEDKLSPYDEAAFGISGMETAFGSVMSLVHAGKLELPALVGRLTWGPAQIVDRRKVGIGTLKAGAPADVAVLDPSRPWRVETARFASKGKNSPLEEHMLKGMVVATVFGGAMVHDARPQEAPRGR